MWAKWALGWKADEEANEEGESEVRREGERVSASGLLACDRSINQEGFVSGDVMMLVD